MQVMIPASAGELVDKITILEIKKSRIKDRSKLKYVNKELGLLKNSLDEIMKQNKKLTTKLAVLKKKLKAINTSLWDTENVIRGLEAKKDFGSKFIQYARSVYITNDKRSEVKAEINKLFGPAALNEVKQYTGY
jgi:predicted  nucleic acid-binding Zn-ribbon protein